VLVECAYEENLHFQIPDTTLAGYCRGRNVVFITQDEDIRKTAYRAQAFYEVGIGYVEVRARKGTGEQKVEVYRKHQRQLLELLDETLPFCCVVSRDRFAKEDLLARVTARERSRDV
jgi:hypothetical protein